MTYAEFRDGLKSLMGGNKALPSIESLIPIVQQSLIEVARKTEPLLLITSNKEEKILQVIDENLFVRQPKKILDENSIIEIDDTLIYAVMYLSATKFSIDSSVSRYRDEANKIISDYNWERFRSFENGSCNDLISLAIDAIDFHGYKKIYLERIKTTKGYFYDWDASFIDKLDAYLGGTILKNLSKSDINNIDNFIAFADNTMTEEHEEYSTMLEFDKKLSTIGVQIGN
jgi:hypothetical protein